ncbi:hypothetical protein [Altericista sp. CCNU0014]|uniref:hypothetical protein n=1 Tax=Altericista sp. CCNU0014 TaxID=3082949 RepID=UPI0038514320
MSQKIQTDLAIAQTVLAFIRSRYSAAQQRSLAADDLLLEGGIIDSMGFIDLIAFIESEFEIVVEGEDMVPEHFQTVNSIAHLIEIKQASR